MLGKQKCKLLRDIRRKIADGNEIPFVTEECKYKGECSGTCPKCEAELRYLEDQLEKRRAIGKAVTVSALSLGIITSAAGCNIVKGGTLEGDVPYTDGEDVSFTENETTLIEIMGSIASGTDANDYSTENNERATETGGEEFSLEGDVCYEPET